LAFLPLGGEFAENVVTALDLIVRVPLRNGERRGSKKMQRFVRRARCFYKVVQ
jgi:hypothetical protein